MKPIKAVIFDLGNVLVSFDHTIAAKKVGALCNKNPREIFRFFFDSPLTRLFEEGKISPSDFFAEVKQSLNLNLSYGEFLPIWNGIFFLTEDNRAVNSVAMHLRDFYKTAILSNINVLHFDYLKNNFPIFAPFHEIMLSFKLKSVKPDSLAYKSALEKLRAGPSEVFYTDDRPELVRESRRLGIRGFVYRDAAQLKKDLEFCGVRAGL